MNENRHIGSRKLLQTRRIGKMKKVIGYNVIDNQTKSVIKTYPEGQGKSARNFANKKDLAYGAVRYVVTFIWS